MALRCRGGVDGLNAVALASTRVAKSSRRRADIVEVLAPPTCTRAEQGDIVRP